MIRPPLAEETLGALPSPTEVPAGDFNYTKLLLVGALILVGAYVLYRVYDSLGNINEEALAKMHEGYVIQQEFMRQGQALADQTSNLAQTVGELGSQTLEILRQADTTQRLTEAMGQVLIKHQECLNFQLGIIQKQGQLILSQEHRWEIMMMLWKKTQSMLPPTGVSHIHTLQMPRVDVAAQMKTLLQGYEYVSREYPAMVAVAEELMKSQICS
jgi:hypothetical protein